MKRYKNKCFKGLIPYGKARFEMLCIYWDNVYYLAEHYTHLELIKARAVV